MARRGGRVIRGSLAGMLSLVLAAGLAGEASATMTRFQSFSSDPGWAGNNNRSALPCTEVRQDFGFSPTTNFAGTSAGEIGGSIGRSLTGASYARPIATKTLDDPMRASGSLRAPEPGDGTAMFGWFNQRSRDWRTPNSLVMRLDGHGGFANVNAEYGTSSYQANSTSSLQLDPGKKYDWTLTYDPRGAGGAGEVVLLIGGQTVRAPLLPGHKLDGASFDRFGFLNVQVPGASTTLYVDDLTLDGVSQGFSAGSDPAWEERGNRSSFTDCQVHNRHDFGWTPTAEVGDGGSIGGLVWRTETDQPQYRAHYGDRLQTLTLDDELEATGFISLRAASSDSGVFLGWFNRDSASDNPDSPPTNLLAAEIGGLSQEGHNFRPVYRTAGQEKGTFDRGPRIVPEDTGRHPFRLHYLPLPDGTGRIDFTFDGQTVTLPVPASHRQAGATLNRFGIRNFQRGGHSLRAYFDDLTYTYAPPGPPPPTAPPPTPPPGDAPPDSGGTAPSVAPTVESPSGPSEGSTASGPLEPSAPSALLQPPTMALPQPAAPLAAPGLRIAARPPACRGREGGRRCRRFPVLTASASASAALSGTIERRAPRGRGLGPLRAYSTFSLTVEPGLNRLPLSRLGRGRALPPGAYRLSASLGNGAQRSPVSSVGFVIRR